MSSQNVVIAMTGASGSIYAIRLITALLSANRSVHLVVSGAARQVMLRELEVEFPASGAGEAAWRQFLTGALNSRIAKLWGFAASPSAADIAARDVLQLLNSALATLPQEGVSVAAALELLTSLCDRLQLADSHAFVIGGLRARVAALVRSDAARAAQPPSVAAQVVGSMRSTPT